MAGIVETIKAMPPKNKMILFASIAAAVAGVILFILWIQQADYQVLYSNLSENDAGGIVQRLKELKVPYKLETGSIMVPADRVYDLRLQLAAQGLPHGGGVGFELFDKSDFGATDFVQKLNYRRALQGELSRTVMSLTEVEQARVHLAIPEKSLFAQEGNNPSASVLVKLRPGRTLSQGQIQGIVHLVSSSIEGLNPKNVTVVDSRGEMLTRPSGDDLSGLSSSQLEFQRNYEKEMEARILGILEPIVGKNKVRARATAALDFTKIEKTEEKYDPDGQVIRSEQKSIEKSTGSGAGGVPGVASNLPARSAAQTVGLQAGSQKQHETTNYEISKITSHTVNASGELKKLSVAVIVDGVYTEQEGSKEKKYSPRSEDDLKKYEDLVKKAVGYTADRGDEVRVVNMQFEGLPQEETVSVSRPILPYIMTAAKYLAPVIAIVLLFMFLTKALNRMAPAPEVRPAGISLPGTVAEIEKALAGGAETKALPTPQEDVAEWAKKNPELAAGLVKGWMEEK